MKNIPLKGLSKEDRTAELWRREKKADARKLRDTHKKRLDATARMLLDAAREVVRKWATHDLAAAVRELDLAITDYDKERK